MRKSVTIVVALIAVAVLAVLYSIWLPSMPAAPDPLFKGKPASVWARDQALNDDWATVNELKQIGAPAVPFLIPYLERRGAPLRDLLSAERRRLARRALHTHNVLLDG